MQRATSSAVPARRKRRWALVVVAAALVPILAMTLFVSHRTVALIGGRGVPPHISLGCVVTVAVTRS